MLNGFLSGHQMPISFSSWAQKRLHFSGPLDIIWGYVTGLCLLKSKYFAFRDVLAPETHHCPLCIVSFQQYVEIQGRITKPSLLTLSVIQQPWYHLGACQNYNYFDITFCFPYQRLNYNTILRRLLSTLKPVKPVLGDGGMARWKESVSLNVHTE